MLADSNFGIGTQALAVLAYLNAHDGIEPSYKDGRYHAEVKCAPWYNGRERGIVFYMRNENHAHQVNIAVFEHRNSDSICTIQWEDTGSINPPSLADIPEGVYKDKWDTTADFEPGRADKAAEWIYDQLTEFWLKYPARVNKVVDTATA